MRLSGLIIVLLMSWSGAAWAAVPVDIAQQRQWFLDARAALKSDHDEQFEQLKARLKDYPLFPYLELWQARSALDLQQDARVETVLARHADIPEAVDLRLAWIKNLAERGQWPHVAGQLTLMPGVEARLPEIVMVTLWRTGYKDEALAIFGERWRRGETHADISLAVEQAWLQSGHPTIEERWGRILVLAKRGRWQQANDLAAALSPEQQQWLKQWKQMQQDPAKILAHWPTDQKSSVARAMFGDLLHRLARRDVRLAWQALSHHRREAGDDFHVYQKRIALRAAKQHVPEATGWLARLPKAQQNNETRAWRVRLYLLQRDYRRALATIRSMPERQQKLSRWMFWKAEALNSLGRKANARRLYEELAKGRGYYSFLSAEHLGQPYQFSGSDFESDATARHAIADLPAMQRAYEWWMLGEAGKANREWYLAMHGATPGQWKAAAGLAMDWGWYDRMIYSAYRAGEMNALSYRFPQGFEDSVHKLAGVTGLTPSLIWSVIRQESAFNQRAVSRTGARGLMQLMPRTAQHVANKNDFAVQPDDLFDAGTNIQLGSLYLSELNERFDGKVALMTAAYNAGPTRVSRWLERTPFENRAAWIEAIPFNETRRYVQQVMAFMVVYDWLQAKAPKTLSSDLASLPPVSEPALN